MKAVKGEQIFLTTENKAGKLEEVAKLIKDSQVNVRAIAAYADSGKAVFELVTSDNAKVMKSLKGLGSLEKKEVVIVEMPDEIGQLCVLASKLKDADIDLNFIYGTTSQAGASANIIFSSSDNDKALEVISN